MLCTVVLEPELFEAAAMMVGTKDLMAMKVTELKEELAGGAWRGEDGSRRPWLRRRLHAAILRAHLDAEDV